MKKPDRFSERYYRIDTQGTAEYPLDPDGVTELRTHGVSGAPPEDLVNDPHPLFVSGDDKAGFYRRLDPPEIGPDRNVEAYSWSAISSRSATRAFWLLLFPFAMVNHAGWMVGPKPNGAWERALIRLIGLLLTVHYALWAMVVFVDLLAYQCGRSEACRGRYLLGWFNSITEFVGPSVIRQVLVLSIFPLAVVLALLWTGRGDPSNFARWPGTDAGDDKLLVDTTPLRDPRFWQAPDVTRLLAASHGVGAVAVLGATLAGAVTLLTEPNWTGRIRALHLGLWALAGVSAVLVVSVGSARHGPGGVIGWRRAVRLTAVATGLTVAGLVSVSWNAPVRPGLPVTLGALRNSFDGVLVAEFGLLMVYFVRDQIRMFVAIPAIGWALFWALSRPARAPVSALKFLPGPLWSHWLGAGLLVALAGLAVYTLRNRLTQSAEKLDGRRTPDDPDAHLNNQFWISFGLAPVFLAAVLGIRAAPGAGSRTVAGLAGAAICGLYLMGAARMQVRRAHDYAPRWKLRVGGPGTLAAVGAAALTLVSAAVIVFAAQRLGSAVPVSRSGPPPNAPPGAPVIGYYDELGWIAAAGLGSLLIFGLAFQTRIAGLWRFRFKPAVPDIRRALKTGESAPDQEETLAVRVARARMFASLLDDLDWLVTLGIVAFMACAFSVITGQYLQRSAEDLDRFVGLASWLLVGIAFLVIWLVRGAQKDTGLRRAIGTLWEITGFFPRRFHPMSPPSYGERSVPELRQRLLALTEGSRRVLLLAHSQGTLLCSAVLESLLGGDTRSRLGRIRYVTYGCMLQRSYGRSFPHLVRPDDLYELKAELERLDREAQFRDFPLPQDPETPGWMNFGRTTDYLGGRMFVEPHRPPGCKPEADRPDDIYFDDPLAPAGDPNEIRLWGHSFNYLDGREDPRFREYVERMLGTLDSPPP